MKGESVNKAVGYVTVWGVVFLYIVAMIGSIANWGQF